MSIEIIRAERLAAYLSIDVDTLRKTMREDVSFPKPIQVTDRVRGWLSSDIQKWLQSKRLDYQPRAVHIHRASKAKGKK